jgi:hypothetical protein
MSNTTTTMRRVTGLGLPPRQGWFRNLVSVHPYAKFVALTAALLIIWLIDRELEEVLFDEPMSMVSQSPAGNVDKTLLIAVQEPYMIVFPPGDVAVARLLVEGRTKDRDKLVFPFRADLPAERVKSVLSADGGGVVGLERSDIRVGYDGARVTLVSSPNIPVALRKIRPRVSIKAVAEDPGSPFEFTITPPVISVDGPAYEVDKKVLDEILIPVDEGTKDADLPRLIQRQIDSVLDPMAQTSFVSLVVPPEGLKITKDKRAAGARETITLQLRLHVEVAYPSKLSYELDPLEGGGTLPVPFTGPAESVKKLKDAPELKQALEERLVLVAYVAGAAERIRGDLENDDNKAGLTENVETVVRQEQKGVLEEYGLEQDPKTLRFKMTLLK